jgi:D-alanyl-D-alanine carboxypeptidase
MKRSIFNLAVFFIVVGVVVTFSVLAASTSRDQSQSAGKSSDGAAVDARVKPTSRVRAKTKEATVESTTFSPAAMRNEVLRSELNWTFGGKEQRGWQLYTPLINHLIDTEHQADTADFASALARWQEKCRLIPSGVLDDETLHSMISQWQGARLKDRSYPDPDTLVTGAASDFYHPTRPDELRQVERDTYAAYKRMIAAAAADRSLNLAVGPNGQLAPAEKYLKIISAFRSREYQDQLRRQTPHSGRAGLAVNSPHFTGRSLDLYVGGDPVETKDSNRAIQVQTRVYQWLVQNAERFGFRPYFYEPWHWECVK